MSNDTPYNEKDIEEYVQYLNKRLSPNSCVALCRLCRYHIHCKVAHSSQMLSIIRQNTAKKMYNNDMVMTIQLKRLAEDELTGDYRFKKLICSLISAAKAVENTKT